MKKISLLLLGVMLTVLNTFAFTPPQYEDVVSGTWTTGSTIRLYNSIVIAPGTSLTIQPGVTVLICDTGTITAKNQSGNKIEIDVLGNFYCMGTAAQPIVIKVADSLINTNTYGVYGQYWGSFFCDTTCHEFLMTYTNVSNTGYVTTNTSYSVQLGLFKAAAGETTPVVNFRGGMGINGGAAPHGKLVVENSTFHNTSDDCIYVEGGNFIIANNTVYTEGESGGDCFDIKSGSWGDICYNLIFSPNTNGIKLANTLGYNPTIDVVGYNNTIVNAGWRRSSVKGGSIWMESGAIAHIYNNLIVDCRFGVKNSISTGGGADASSVWDYQYYFGRSQVCVNQFQPYNATTKTGTKDVILDAFGDNHDVRGTVKNQNDPLFVNYPFSPSDTSTGTGTVGYFLGSTFNTSWDFRLMPKSPAIGKGTANVTGHFNTTGITFSEGLSATYTSPVASTTPGAFRALIGVTGITVSAKTASINVGVTKTLTAAVAPANADTLTYSWTSTDPTIATVDQNGVVTGIKRGIVKIYAKTSNAPYADTCTFTIIQAVTGVTVSPKTASLNVGATKSITATIAPANANDLTVTWNSTNTAVATVDANGLVTAVGPGIAKIYVTTNTGSFTDTATLTIIQPVAGITVTPSTDQIKVGSSVSLSAAISPANASDQIFSWVSLDPATATVNDNGSVKGIAAGTVKIVAISDYSNDIADTAIITVTQPVTGISVSPKVVNVLKDSTANLNSTLTPFNATDTKVTWASKNTAIATVDQTGNVKGISIGTTKVYMKSDDGGFTDTCNVTVSKDTVAVKGISVSPKTKQITVGDSTTIIANISPDSATNIAVEWASTNKKVATVTADGIVHALTVGTAKIYVKALDGGFTDTCVVTVKAIAVSGITVTPQAKELMATETFTIEATVVPTDAGNLAVTWSSSDKTVATVSTSGVVTAVAAGTATITATTVDGGFTGTCVITVTPLVSVKTISSEGFNLYPNPVSTELQLQFNATANKSRVTVYSVLGQAVLNQNFEHPTGMNTILIGVENLQNGLYFINVQNGNTNITKSFIKK